ncbi:M23 family metallopeptidase [Nocardiopsis sp. HNM0947]|uniref:M23 family metallopeptidase n=1 Tax=Nocardiopsis coralli TaxID=2772213 RepID=A0ABR9P8T6_9ACTN|nr:peptidoglycan DD-metalloendopeptidase family protein [Nocardiopsis coralli]MBE3000263.1 M23 family metallopeptidase [Nocardiopsis coralli]
MRPPTTPRAVRSGRFIPHQARSTALTLTAATALLVSAGVAQASPAPASVDLADASNVGVLVTEEIAADLPASAGGATAEEVLADAVVEDVLTEHGTGLKTLDAQDREVRVDVREAEGAAAFGVAIVTAAEGAEDSPNAWLFTADHAGGEWAVGLEGTPEFAELLAESELMDAEERDTIATSTDPDRVSPNQATGVGLPFEIGTSMTMTSGPHGWGSEPPLSSVDFAGGAGTAHAARGGYAYSLCDGWTRVIHDNGYSTDYYHLEDYQWLDGDVETGSYLGTQGNSLCAGGSTTGPHIHFGLRAYDDPNGAGWYVGLNGLELGGWTFVEGAAYGGYAHRDGAEVHPGGSMHNYGF